MTTVVNSKVWWTDEVIFAILGAMLLVTAGVRAFVLNK